MFENRIEELMDQKNISDEQLCQSTGLTRMTLWNLKKGKNVTLRTMRLIARVLGEPISAIWPEEERAA